MKLFMWCLTGLTSFFMGMIVMGTFNSTPEIYGDKTNEVKVENISSSSSQGIVTKKPEKFNVSLTEALKIYKDCYPDKKITSIDVNKRIGPYCYEITGKDGEKAYNLKISTNTNKVKKNKVIILKKNEQMTIKQHEETLNIKKLKSLSEITKIAEQQINKGEAIKWYLEKKKDKTVWLVTIKEERQTFKVQVDAYTGKVLEISAKV
ncbi:MAG: PepSY domain-containing protein [Enterococcus lacertideformus]|uniref:PepSY domain-containing protein n=1 Tax=Enterococcus lacertideformus TaxID=2771493 RepID=A0A931AV31_9ENTE|nr:PepSY domain-containing protein [Enterococcus lacertideformus]